MPSLDAWFRSSHSSKSAADANSAGKAAAKEGRPGPGAAGNGEDQRQGIEVGDPLGGEAVLADREPVDGGPGDRDAGDGAAEGEVDQDARLGSAPAVDADAEV